jgi:chorismate-pyruvate lyase
MATSAMSESSLMRTDLQASLRRSPVDPTTLTSFQRILLTTDGTVTDMLEAYLWERITVVKLFEDEFQLEHGLPLLDLAAGGHVMDRRILLQGRVSHVNHIYAESLIAPDRLDSKIREGLRQSNKAIGLLILENRLETFREIVACGRERAGDLAEHLDVDPDDDLISRVYRVIAGGQPIMVITEKFAERGPA